MGRGGQLYFPHWFGEDNIGRTNCQGFKHRTIWRVHGRAGCDPITQDAVFIRVLCKALPTFVFG